MRSGRDPERGEILFGVHPILEALETGSRPVDRIWVAREGVGAGAGRLLRMARAAGIPVTHLPREALALKAGRRSLHQGIAASVAAARYADAGAACDRALRSGRGLLVIVDGVEDPRNLGAILRTSAAAGAGAVLLAAESTVGLTATVAKASSGALERIEVAREPRIVARIGRLRESGAAVLALDPRGETAWDRLPEVSGPVAVVAGGEGRGLRAAVSAASTARVRIPLAAGIESLNVSVATAVLLFEVVRRRRLGGGAGLS